MLGYYLGKLAQINYQIAIHPENSNIRLTSQADKILVISTSTIPEQYRKQFIKLTNLIDASYADAERMGVGLHLYKLLGIRNSTASKYIKLLLDIEFSIRDKLESGNR
jgi:hypothetical protein